ncbi:MAG TPA: hypothetical protein EYG03_08980 [Planctomycetes bacterium]|nr:hypothetical protein [Fuerstiella sp.]HIK92097.1 hypothetical protein [Planctomycetota bacterium]
MHSCFAPLPLPRRNFLGRALLGAGASILSPSFGRADDSAGIVDRDLAAAMGKAELSLQFRGHTADECRAWQDRFQTKLGELMGDSTPPAKWTIVEENRVEFDEYSRLELLLNAEGVPSLPVYLLVPKGLSVGQQTPAVLCVHGHGPFGNDAIVGRREQEGAAEHIAKLNYDYGVQFAKRGYVVAAPCMIPFGRRVDSAAYRGNDPCAVTFVRMQALGQLPITANVRDLRWSIDLLQSRPEVNDDAIGCAGLSYGGRMTMMVSAIDKRVRVAAVSGALNLMQERMTLRHSCGSQIVPGLLKYGDYSEIGSLIAPRPCVWETGSKDSLIVPKWDEVFRGRLRRVYEAMGAGSNLHFDRFEGGHEWSGRIAFPLFDEVLKS